MNTSPAKARMAVSVDPPPELPLGDVETLVVSCNKDALGSFLNGSRELLGAGFRNRQIIGTCH